MQINPPSSDMIFAHKRSNIQSSQTFFDSSTYDTSSHLRSPVEGEEAEDEDEAAQPGEGHRVARDGLALAVLQVAESMISM